MTHRFERWRIQPAQAPRPWRHCSTCGTTRQFVCSGRFRTNAQKKCIDVWLNYRCDQCSAVWKLPLLERCAVTELHPSLLEAFARHDPVVVQRYAHDVARLRSHAIRIDTDGGYHVERSSDPNDAVASDAAGLEIALEVLAPCDLRLDRLLSGELNMSRTAVQRWYEEGRLSIEPAQKDPLRRRVRDGQRVRIADRT
jgi:hypothetical protein